MDHKISFIQHAPDLLDRRNRDAIDMQFVISAVKAFHSMVMEAAGEGSSTGFPQMTVCCQKQKARRYPTMDAGTKGSQTGGKQVEILNDNRCLLSYHLFSNGNALGYGKDPTVWNLANILAMNVPLFVFI